MHSQPDKFFVVDHIVITSKHRCRCTYVVGKINVGATIALQVCIGSSEQ